MDAILQNWQVLLAGAVCGGGAVGLVFLVCTRLKRRRERRELAKDAANSGRTIDCDVLVNAPAEARPCMVKRAARRLGGMFASCVQRLGDMVRAAPWWLADRTIGAAGRIAAVLDPAVTRDKDLATRIGDERIAWRARFAPASERWLFRNPKALASVTRGLEQSAAGQTVKYPPLLDGKE